MAWAAATYITIGLLAASAAVSTYAAVESSAAQEESAKYNAAIQNNAASAAAAEAAAEAARSKNRARRLVASQRTQFAKSGGALSGSALDVLYDTALQAQMDQDAILYRGNRRASDSLDTANLYRRKASSVASQRGLTIGGTLLGGLSGAAGAVPGKT